MIIFVFIYLARVSIARIEKFLNEPELTHQNSQPSSSNDPKIGFRNASFQWPNGAASTDDLSNCVDNNFQNPFNKFTLINLNIEFPALNNLWSYRKWENKFINGFIGRIGMFRRSCIFT